MHGPASTSGGSYKAPTWPDLPWIDVLDTIALSLRAQADKWRFLRDESLEVWGGVTGLRFKVIEEKAFKHPKLDPLDISDEHLESVMVKPYLRLMAMKGLYNNNQAAIAAWMPATNPAAFAAFYMPSFWGVTPKTKRFRLRHEIGHCLGLNHWVNGEPGVMSTKGGLWTGGLHPTDHDLLSLKGYYLAV